MVETKSAEAVELSADHIKRGGRRSFTMGPIALAVKERYPSAERVFVDWRGIEVTVGGGHFRHDAVNGSPIRNLVNQWNMGMPIEPQTLMLRFRRVQRAAGGTLWKGGWSVGQSGAELNVKLVILQADIDDGIPEDSGQSPAANALGYWSRLHGPGDPHYVDIADRVMLDVGDRRWETDIKSCGDLWSWLSDFDYGIVVEPAMFKFTLHEDPDFQRDRSAADRRTPTGGAGGTAPVEYPAEVELDEDGRSVVSFPDFGWGATDGATREEALAEARFLLRDLIAATIRDGKELPEPSRADRQPLVRPPDGNAGGAPGAPLPDSVSGGRGDQR